MSYCYSDPYYGAENIRWDHDEDIPVLTVGVEKIPLRHTPPPPPPEFIPDTVVETQDEMF